MRVKVKAAGERRICNVCKKSRHYTVCPNCIFGVRLCVYVPKSLFTVQNKTVPTFQRPSQGSELQGLKNGYGSVVEVNHGSIYGQTTSLDP